MYDCTRLSIPLLEMTSLGRSFSVNRSIEFEKLHGSLLVYYGDFHRARSNLDVFDNIWCARSVQKEFSYAWTEPCILAPFSCCTNFRSGLLGHFVVACLMHGELSVTEIHWCQNSEFSLSNSQLPACILYGRKNDLIYQVISAPVDKGIVEGRILLATSTWRKYRY